MTTTIRLAGAAQGFNWLPVYVAEELGLFAAHGIEIQYLRLGSVDRATSAVRDGDADLAITPPEGAITDFLAGGDLRIVAANSVAVPMSLVARPEFADLNALRGARIGTSSLTEGTAIYTRLLLDRAGLTYPGDYEFVLAGVHTTRWDALQAGEIDAAPQPAPWNFLAAREGFTLLAEVSDVLPRLLFAAVIGRVDRVASSEGPVEALLAALADAHALIADPSNDDRVLPIYTRITTPEHPDLAARGFAFTRDLGMWPVPLDVPAAAFDSTLDVMVAAGLIDPARRAEAQGVLVSRPGAAFDSPASRTATPRG